MYVMLAYILMICTHYVFNADIFHDMYALLGGEDENDCLAKSN